MSRVRSGTCADPGPGDLHCQDSPGHRYTCHDGEDCWAEWHFEAFGLAPHACSDPDCPFSTPPAPEPAAVETPVEQGPSDAAVDAAVQSAEQNPLGRRFYPYSDSDYRTDVRGLIAAALEVERPLIEAEVRERLTREGRT